MDKKYIQSLCYAISMTNMSDNIGAIGESIAARFLSKKGIQTVEKNFTRSWGELDLIAKSGEEAIFVEVKTMRCRIPDEIPADGANVHRPEEKVNKAKRKRLRRIVQTYIADHSSDISKWRVDLICVYFDTSAKQSKVKWIKNVIV